MSSLDGGSEVACGSGGTSPSARLGGAGVSPSRTPAGGVSPCRSPGRQVAPPALLKERLSTSFRFKDLRRKGKDSLSFRSKSKAHTTVDGGLGGGPPGRSGQQRTDFSVKLTFGQPRRKGEKNIQIFAIEPNKFTVICCSKITSQRIF